MSAPVYHHTPANCSKCGRPFNRHDPDDWRCDCAWPEPTNGIAPIDCKPDIHDFVNRLRPQESDRAEQDR